MMIDVGEDTTTRDAAARDNTELSASESPTEHAFAWALDDGDDGHDDGDAGAQDAGESRHGWRTVLLRAVGVFGVFLAGAAVIIALWHTDGRRFVSPERPSAPVPSAPVAAPAPATVTVIQTAPPPAQTESPPPPVVAPPAPVHRVPSPAADQTYLALARQIPGVVITDPGTAVSGGRNICPDLMSHGRSHAEAAVQANDPGFTTLQSSALVDAAITAYCPQYGEG